MAITDSTHIISIKESYIAQYLSGLFSGSIVSASESGGTWALTIGYDQTNGVASDIPTLSVGDPITIYDSLVYPTGTFFEQYPISAVNSLTEIEITTSDTISDTYNWRLFAPHTQTAEPRVFTLKTRPTENKSDAPIVVASGIKNLYNDRDRRSACTQGFLMMVDTVCTVELFQTDKKWSSAAVQSCKEFCDTKALIMKQNLDFSEIKEDLSGRFDHYMQSKESYGNKFFVEIDYNRLIRP